MQLNVKDIRTDGGTQPRAELDELVIEEYAYEWLNGSKFPPVVTFYDGAEYWLADGFHRLAAAIRAGFTEIDSDIKQGERREAVLYSCGVNADHGLRRTNDDKRRAVETLLRDEEWSKWSDREIARRCAVSDRFVNKMRPEVTANGSQLEPTVSASRVRA